MDIPTAKVISVCSGIAGLDRFAQELDWQTVCYIEHNPYRQQVIQARSEDGLLDRAPIWDDLRTFDGKPWRGVVDGILAGFPCQPFSTAGKRKAAGDERNLWPEVARVIAEIQPWFCFLENVPGLRHRPHRYIATILAELAHMGFDAVWGSVSASQAGAPHRRDRLWILAYASDSGCTRWRGPTEQEHEHDTVGRSEQLGPDGEARDVAHPESKRTRPIPVRQRRSYKASTDADGGGTEVANTEGEGWSMGRIKSGTTAPYTRLEQPGETMADPTEQGLPLRGRSSLGESEQERESDGCSSPREPVQDDSGRIPDAGWWAIEPDVGRVAHGIPRRVDRLAALGDAVVSQQALLAWKLLTGQEVTE